MPLYLKNNKLLSNKIIKQNNTINKKILSNHINVATSNRLFGKNSSIDRAVYLSQNPHIGQGAFVRNPNCWIHGVSNISCFSPAQLSGSAWNTRGGALLTRKHALFAKHYLPAIISGGTPLIFVDDNNNSIQRKIIQFDYDYIIDPSSGTYFYTDLAIALLDNEVPDNIKIAKVLPPNFRDYINTNSPISTNLGIEVYSDTFIPSLYAVGLDQQEKAILKLWSYNQSLTLLGSNGSYFDWYQNSYLSDNENNSTYPSPDQFSGWFEPMITGDSGNPVFIIIDNELVLLTCWWTSIGGTFITNRYNSINNIIESLSPNQGYSLTPIDLASVYAKYS
jgi:hypothetical protein